MCLGFARIRAAFAKALCLRGWPPTVLHGAVPLPFTALPALGEQSGVIELELDGAGTGYSYASCDDIVWPPWNGRGFHLGGDPLPLPCSPVHTPPIPKISGGLGGQGASPKPVAASQHICVGGPPSTSPAKAIACMAWQVHSACTACVGLCHSLVSGSHVTAGHSVLATPGPDLTSAQPPFRQCHPFRLKAGRDWTCTAEDDAVRTCR